MAGSLTRRQSSVLSINSLAEWRQSFKMRKHEIVGIGWAKQSAPDRQAAQVVGVLKCVRPRRWGLSAIAVVLAPCLTVPVHAQTFPQRTVKLIVPVPPGGSTDALARLVTLRMQAILGQ